MSITLARMTKNGGRWQVQDPRPGKEIQVFDGKNVEEALALHDKINAEIAAEITTDNGAPSGPKMVVKASKAILTASGLGYKGQLFGGYVADWEALLAYFGSPADSQARKDFDANRTKLAASWQAYGDIPVGATLPDGTTKPAPKGR